MSDEVSAGPVAPAPDDSAGSSKKVNGAGRRNGRRASAYGKDDETYRRYVFDLAGNGTAQQKGKSSGRGQQSYGSSSTSSQSTAGHSGGRKSQTVNGNHLLNFHYDPISRAQPRLPPPKRQQRKQPYNKDLFLQANYKFVLLDSGNHSPGSMDPDKNLQWEDILCVKYSSPAPIQCPICLEEPLCPQITSCGHIFCFPCILRYIFMSEEDYKVECWKKCPLCFMMISSKDLYTIYLENVVQHCVGDTIEFMLLTRQKASFILSQKNKQGIDKNDEVCDSYSKFTYTSDVNVSVRKAMSELDGWLARADSGLVDDIERLPYVCAAMEHLEERKKSWNSNQASIGSNVSTSSDSLPRSPLTFSPSTDVGNSDSDKSTDQSADASEVCEDQDGGESFSKDDNNSMQKRTQEKDSYSFYQAVDGQHLILHPLNMKCLLHHYGSYENLPNRISGKILQLETVTQSEAIRRRYRYLSHFSLTTTFQLCEIDASDILPPSALSPFMDQIQNREKQRNRIAKKEQEEKLKSEAEAVREYVVVSPSELARSYNNNIPTFSNDEFEALGSPVVVSSSPPAIGERPLFSNVARLGFAAGCDSPVLKTELLGETSTATTTGSRDPVRTPSSSSSSFASIISRTNQAAVESSNKVSNELGKKGKKPNKVLLLSTAGGRRY
jgi:hypothetical protein